MEEEGFARVRDWEPLRGATLKTAWEAEWD